MKSTVTNGNEMRTLLRSAKVGDVFFTNRRNPWSTEKEPLLIGTYVLTGARTKFEFVCTGRDVGLVVLFRKLKHAISLHKGMIRFNRVAAVLFSSNQVWNLLVPSPFRTKCKKAPHNAHKRPNRRAHKRKS